MADFGRGMKAGVVTGIVYMAIAAILGTIYYNSFSIPNFIYGTGLILFTWRSLTDFSFVMSLLVAYIYRGIVFGAVFAALYSFLPGTKSVKKGVVLSAFLCIVALIEVIYMTPGWPTEGISVAGSYYSGQILLSSSFSTVWPGIISALVFGALIGFLWGRFRPKRPAEARKDSPVLLVSFILGLAIWVIVAVLFLLAVVTTGFPTIQPEFWWSDLLGMLVVFLGLPGWILARAAWKKTKVDKSGFKWGVAGGVLMALTGLMLLPGVLAIIGGVLSERKPASEFSTVEIGAIVGDKIAKTGEQKKRTDINRNLILLITSMTMLTITIIVGFTTSISPTPTPIEIRDWYDLNAMRDNLGGTYLLMNDLDSTTAGYEELASEAANQGKGWQPIGTFIPQHRYIGFDGTFDGQGYEIRDLFINRPDEDDGVGLFGFVTVGGVIKNLAVMNADVTGYNNTGCLVGVNYHGTLINSYATGSVIGDAGVGGLVGFSVSGNVSNSYSTGSVTGEEDVGGLVGAIFFGTVNSSYSTGSVTGNARVGGLVGHSVRGNVSNSYSTGSITGNSSVGGLLGCNEYYGTVNNSYSSSSVTGNNCTGGLVGANGGSVSNSYATGSVIGDAGVGGLVGGNMGNVTACYSTSNVTGNSSVGGLVGENTFEWSPLLEGTVSNSFWDTQTSGQAISHGGIGKNTTEMQDITTFSGAGWNITAVANPSTRNPSCIWNIVDEQTYPYLSWQPVS